MAAQTLWDRLVGRTRIAGLREGRGTEGVRAAGTLGAGLPAGAGLPEPCTPGTGVETRQMTEKRFTIWPVLFPIKPRTLVNMQGWEPQAEIMCR